MEEEFSVEEYLLMETLPHIDCLTKLTEQVCNVLLTEVTDYRKENCIGEPGSLLELVDSRPAIIIPDLHARPDFLLNILNYKLPADFCGKECTVKQALQEKIINIICVGDAIHSELTSHRWKLIVKEFEQNIFTGDQMQKEMISGLSVLCGIMKLKIDNRDNFHFLKGNHENILNANFGGDYSFYKYANEGEMVRQFMLSFYNEKLLYLIAKYENLLPLVAAGKNYVVSHGEPADVFTKEQLIDAKFEDNVVEGLIWTKNGEVKKQTCKPIMEELIGVEAAQNAVYFAGHRPVKENFSLRQDGVFVQIHNPHRQNIALVYANKKFDAENDIVKINDSGVDDE